MSRTKYQVFVSSTFRGLQDERRLVMQALLEMDCIPSGMELFPASSDEVWTLIESVIAEADYFVLILGGRYGSTDENGVSYTEREYDLAVAKGIPVLPFLHGDPGKIPAELSEMLPDSRAKLTAFREKMEDAHHCKYWTTADGLSGAVSRSLNLMVRTNPRVGWIRGDMAKTVEEVERASKLQERVRELEQQVGDLERRAEDETSGFSQGDDMVPVDAGLFDGDYAPSDIGLTWNCVFVAVAEAILGDPEEQAAVNALEQLTNRLADAANKPHPRIQRALAWRAIERQFLALNLIEVNHVPRETSGFERKCAVLFASRFSTVWRLTPRGQGHFARLTAIKRTPVAGAGE